MKYVTASAFRAALETRLLARSKEANTSLIRLRKMVVFDRLLARLLVSAPGRWHLKGALALDFRLGPGTRTTKDMDLGRADDEAAMSADFRAVQRVDLNDWFVFAVERTGALDQIVDEVAVRYRVAVTLAGRPFEQVTVDVAFGGFSPAPDAVYGPDLLTFAGISPLTIPVLPLEIHVAEKLHAYTRVYGVGRQNTRVKDLVDLVLIQSAMSFDAGSLRAALVATFAMRGLHPLPLAFPSPPSDWGPTYRKLAQEIGLPPDVAVGYRDVSIFVNPLLDDTLGDRANWDNVSRGWVP